MNGEKHYHLYVLLCEQDKYYVGITTKTPEQRMYDHLHGVWPASWTQKYKPLKIFQTKDLGYISEDRARRYENIVTREYINKYKIENVRGGDITKVQDYKYRFGRYFLPDDWSALKIVGFFMITLLVMGILYYLK